MCNPQRMFVDVEEMKEVGKRDSNRRGCAIRTLLETACEIASRRQTRTADWCAGEMTCVESQLNIVTLDIPNKAGAELVRAFVRQSKRARVASDPRRR